jgi:hypothetical protein
MAAPLFACGEQRPQDDVDEADYREHDAVPEEDPEQLLLLCLLTTSWGPYLHKP